MSRILLSLAALVGLAPGAEPAPPAAFLDFTLAANDGSPYPLRQHAGRVILLVNTASRCGFTGQYEGLETLWTTYRERGLVVIAVPANDFLGQEPGSDADIRQFCTLNYGVSFPLMAKAQVTGRDMHPLYRWLTTASPKAGAIGWNFTKFLVGRDGTVVERFSPMTKPGSRSVIAAIERELARPTPD